MRIPNHIGIIPDGNRRWAQGAGMEKQEGYAHGLAPGLVVGCLITNLLSPYGPIDIVMGTLATAIAAVLTAKMPRWYLAALPPILVNMVILAPMWSWAETNAINSAFWALCGYNAGTFVIGEAAVCYVLGTVLLQALPRLSVFRSMVPQDRLARVSA